MGDILAGTTRVVVVGAGFAGLDAVKELEDAPVEVTLLDRRNHHLFQPLLYQVATAGLNPSDIAQPIRHVVGGQRNCRVLMADVADVDLDARRLQTDLGPIDYDYLIVATGATHDYFGNQEWARHAPGLKTVEDALDIRRRLLTAFERAETTADRTERQQHMTFVVVGAGPTGVELAGAIKEIATHSLSGDFRVIDTSEAKVLLVEAGPQVLPAFPEKLSASAERQLTNLGVEVRTSCMVVDVRADGVSVRATGTEDAPTDIASSTVVWAAGVAASPLGAALSGSRDKAGRVPVTVGLNLAGHDEVFVIGDLAAISDAKGVEVPGVAPAAQQAGRHAARSIMADLEGRGRDAFVYRDKGSMATIGRSAAVVHLGPFDFSGYPAWVAWWLVHIWSLIGFRSRAAVMAGWAWQYLTRRRVARLITAPTPLPGPDRPADHHPRLDHPETAGENRRHQSPSS